MPVSGILYTFQGDVSPSDDFGRSIGAAGDVDRDGYDDVLVGSSMWDVPGSGVHAGAVFVFSGLDGSVLLDLYGDEHLDWFGSSVSGGRDVDHDGVPDVAVAAPIANGYGLSKKGYLRVFSGGTGNVIHDVAIGALGESDDLHIEVALLGDLEVWHSLGGDGTIGFPLTIPAGPSLTGLAIYLQAAYVDPGAPVGVSMTGGAESVIG